VKRSVKLKGKIKHKGRTIAHKGHTTMARKPDVFDDDDEMNAPDPLALPEEGHPEEQPPAEEPKEPLRDRLKAMIDTLAHNAEHNGGIPPLVVAGLRGILEELGDR
jgi:hypothetical protein